MKLSINTSDREKTIVSLDSFELVVNSTNNSSQSLLPAIVKLLSDNQKKISDITDIVVDTGPGSYTGLRVGVSVAQTLGFLLNVPVNGVNIKDKAFIEISYE